jgi:excisionase family DNA binding protein
MHSAIAAIRKQVIAEMKTQQPSAALTRRLLTAAQAGEYIGRTETAIRQMIYKKQLPVVRIGGTVRIDVQDLDTLINDGRM